MSKVLIVLLSFILGGSVGIILMSCLVIAKETDENKKNYK